MSRALRRAPWTRGTQLERRLGLVRLFTENAGHLVSSQALCRLYGRGLSGRRQVNRDVNALREAGFPVEHETDGWWFCDADKLARWHTEWWTKGVK